MAVAAQSQNLEDELTCSICLEYFKNPVTIDCGHNFCQSCISQCWQGNEATFACPQCREISHGRNFRPNRQLGNIVEMLKINLPSLNPQEKVCEKHHQPLQLFCEDDLEPICVVCDRSRDHRSHTVVPIEEAAQDHKEMIQSRLIELKSDLEDLKRLTTKKQKKQVELEGTFQSYNVKIMTTFEDLHRFLEQKKKNMLDQMANHHEKVLEKMSLKMAVMEKHNASLKSLIEEMEGKCQQEDVQLLKDIRSLMNRADSVNLPVVENDSPVVGWSLKHFANHHAKLEEKIRVFKESLTLNLDTSLFKTALHSALRDAITGKHPLIFKANIPADISMDTNSDNSKRSAKRASMTQQPQDNSFLDSPRLNANFFKRPATFIKAKPHP